ncbi:MAG: hypothetical protein CM1200mP16_06850 [Nitrospina sp.]|nr:MAG: hypothetical protein CM1200mP16_06850 [Nitrospina sp.]
MVCLNPVATRNLISGYSIQLLSRKNLIRKKNLSENFFLNLKIFPKTDSLASHGE